MKSVVFLNILEISLRSNNSINKIKLIYNFKKIINNLIF